MKKAATLLLVFLMLLSFLGCSKAGDSKTDATKAASPTLQVGYGRSAFTPKSNVKITNHGQTTSSAIYGDVFITCIALTDADGETVLLFTCDMIRCPDNMRISLLRDAEEATGVSAENMIFAVTHNHNGPNPSAVSAELKKAIIAASTQAMEDRSAATVCAGTAYTEGLNFVRHYEKEDGAWYGAAYTSASSAPLKNHEADPDNAMQLLRFDREGKKSVLMVNWQAHAVYTYDTDVLSADYIGVVRRNVEEGSDCLFAFFQGAAGNLAPTSLIKSLNKHETQSIGGVEAYGKSVAQVAIDALPTLQPVNAEGIDISKSSYTAAVRQDSTDYLDAITKFEEVINAGGTVQEAVIASGDMVHSTISCTFPPMRKQLGASQEIPLVALRLGEIGFVSVPYEMFDTSGMYVKENSPFTMTMILGYTGVHAYIPTAACIAHTCYEWECGYYDAGTAEALAEDYVALLNTLPH